MVSTLRQHQEAVNIVTTRNQSTEMTAPLAELNHDTLKKLHHDDPTIGIVCQWVEQTQRPGFSDIVKLYVIIGTYGNH